MRGWISVSSRGKHTEEVEFEVLAAIHEVLEDGSIENELIDIDKVTSLRDPDLLPELISSTSKDESTKGRKGPVTGYEYKKPTPVPSLMNYDQTTGYRSFDSLPEAHSPIPDLAQSKLREPLAVESGSEEEAIRDPDEIPFILTLPWWIWLCVVLLALVLCGLKAAVGKLLQTEEPYETNRQSF